MMTRLPLSLTFLVLAACAVPDQDSDAAAGAVAETAILVDDITRADLNVASYEVDLRTTIARFRDPVPQLPTDRVLFIDPSGAPIRLDDVLEASWAQYAYDITGGAAFLVVDQAKALPEECIPKCVPTCNGIVICGAMCDELGSSHGYAIDSESGGQNYGGYGDNAPSHGGDCGAGDDSCGDGRGTGGGGGDGTDSGGSSGGSAGGSSGGSSGGGSSGGSGASSGGEGGSAGGVGNPGD